MEWSDAWSIILFILGYLFLALIALRLLASLYRIVAPYLLCPRRNLHARAGARWAVITGATDGIGKAYAFELAEQKFDIFLVSRTASKLVTTKTEILEKFPGVKVEMCAFDFTVPTFEDYQPLLNELASIDVGILVNNVGMAIDCPEKLYEVEGGGEALARISTCNTLPVIILSSAVLEQMVKRKAGVIINISSMAALNEMAYWNVYSAGKHRQVMNTNHSSMNSIRMRITLFIAEDYARSALKTVGNVNQTAGCLAHHVQVKFRIIVFDFTASKIEEYQPLFDELYSYEIGVLVNNVGMTMPCPEILHKVRGDKDELARISTVNTLPMLMLSSAVLEYMALRKKGIIINITTGFALSDAPLWNVYSASKNYALHLSRTLRREYSSYGITIQTLTPMRVFTKSIVPKVDKPSFFVPSAENYARSALKTVGNVNETAGYCAHQLQVKLSENAGQY
ncbi:hypothetical protein PRIPAC_78822 [Pristionchus pacificus]|nr:hypothetical protein PRIPAC_78822 [Pristionchus pacificus]|eukprot:PDM72447.1 dehydrogenase [Pristionchus pacificus]